MAVQEIKENVYWVGAVDWNIRSFHGYSLARRGTTYNAYLILEDKVALFDTVPEKFKWDLYHQVRSLVKLEDIDYIVVNHVELDHSGAFPFMHDRIKPEKVFCSRMGKKAIAEHFHRTDFPLEAVNTGDEISLGQKRIQFMETRMLHWPDSMFSYIPEDKLLISNDAFGQNIASTKRFDDEADKELLFAEAKHYYANIILPYSQLVQKVLSKVNESGLEIDMIAPDHGFIWRSYVPEILKAYDQYSRQVTRDKAVIVYDTMWESTEKMAKAVAEGLLESGVEYVLMSLKSHHHSDVIGELVDASIVVCGSPTHNNGMLPLVADFLTYMQGLRPVNRFGAAFGSYGWSGEAAKDIQAVLQEARFQTPADPVRVKHVPTHEDLAACKELGKKLAAAATEK
ncbi:MAG: FprA family A-type flavoprotein [Desulfonatronovibrionaceae bacterium]